MFDDIIAVMKANKKSSPIVTELFLRGARKLNSFYITILFKTIRTPTNNIESFAGY